MAALLKKIVRNDAMKSDPNEIYGWRVYVLTLSVCFLVCYSQAKKGLTDRRS